MNQRPGHDERLDPLRSPALGTDLDALGRWCKSDQSTPRVDPSPPDERQPVALTLSGGGFRATLAAAGVIRFLADTNLLRDLRYASSVSGGSIANGMLARHWPAIRQAGYSTRAVDDLIVNPLVESISRRSMKWDLIRNLWRVLGAANRTDLLARALDGRFFKGTTLESLDPGCRWIFNAANLTTGRRFAFERNRIGDYVIGMQRTAGTGRTLATAVAASAAVPGAFPPMRVPAAGFPCGFHGDALLLDGGAYDNLGLEALDDQRYRDVFLVVLNAGGVFVTGRFGTLPIIRDLARSNSLLYRQSTALRTRWMVDRFHAAELARKNNSPIPGWGRQGVLFALATEIDGDSAAAWRRAHPEYRTWNDKDLAFVPTVFDRLDPELCRRLVYRGWWLTGATLSYYHPERLTEQELVAPPV